MFQHDIISGQKVWWWFCVEDTKTWNQLNFRNLNGALTVPQATSPNITARPQ